MGQILALSQSHGSAGLGTGVRLSDIAQPSRLLPNTYLIPIPYTSLAKDCAALPNSVPFANPRFPLLANPFCFPRKPSTQRMNATSTQNLALTAIRNHFF